MKKRALQNSLYKEKKLFQFNISKYETKIELERDYKDSKICAFVPVVMKSFISEPQTLLGVDNDHLPQSSTSSLPKNEANSEDVFGILKDIVQRLENCEQNQANIMQNQSVLSNGQTTIVDNQQLITTRLQTTEASIVPKPEIMAQSKRLMECKVAIKKVQRSVCSMTGESYDKNLDVEVDAGMIPLTTPFEVITMQPMHTLDELSTMLPMHTLDEVSTMLPLHTPDDVSTMLPLDSVEALQEVEQKLDTPEFAQAMTTYLHELKGTSDDVISVIRAIFTDELLEKYNWSGKWSKHALGKLMFTNKILRDVFQLQGDVEFEKSMKKAVEQSHHRFNQKRLFRKSTQEKKMKLIANKIEASIVSGQTDNKYLYEVARMLPLDTIAAVQELEQKMDTPDFAQAMTTYLHRRKGTSNDVNSIIRELLTDKVLQKYNWDGRMEKDALRKLMLINKALRDVFQHQGDVEFEKNVKQAVERCRHRTSQKKFRTKSKY